MSLEGFAFQACSFNHSDISPHFSILQLTADSLCRRERLYYELYCSALWVDCPMVALYFMYYNFARVHQTLRVTPAMEAGIADHVWSVEEIVGLLEG